MINIGLLITGNKDFQQPKTFDHIEWFTGLRDRSLFMAGVGAEEKV
jgi:hypothetical protein